MTLLYYILNKRKIFHLNSQTEKTKQRKTIESTQQPHNCLPPVIIKIIFWLKTPTVKAFKDSNEH